MIVLLTLIFFISIIALIVGLIKPSLVLRWVKDEDKHTRRSVAKYFLTAIVVSFTIIMILPTGTDTTTEVESADKDKTGVSDSFKISNEDKEVLAKNFTELTDSEKEYVENLRERIDNAEDSDDKQYAIDNLDRLKTEEEIETARIQAEEEERAEKERVEREKKEEEERVAKEKQDEIDKAAKEKEEKEKYNTGITWKDMARDKDGLSGSYVRFKGEILQVVNGDGYTQYRMAVNSDYDQVILIEILDELLDSNIIEDDIITIEGMSVGNSEYTTVMGDKRSIPSVIVGKFTLH